jgi:hypothetical protein
VPVILKDGFGNIDINLLEYSDEGYFLPINPGNIINSENDDYV